MTIITVNLSTVIIKVCTKRNVLFNVAKNSNVVRLDKVDGDTLSPVTSRPTNSVDVQLTVVRQVVVDDQRDLWHVQTAGPNVSADQHAAKIFCYYKNGKLGFGKYYFGILDRLY